MVFEGILVDLLNRFLGPYVKNLDPSQLRVGIWGGDVLLEKLDLKENALDELNLPIRVFGGHLDTLCLKLPWHNLYNAPVVAEVDGLYILAGPSSAATYDAATDAQEKKEKKDKQIKKVADARKKTLGPKGKAEEAPGFVEKLVTQIIKNVQITIKNIHVTYEDQVTDPANPFSVGVTLDSLFVQSSDSEYVVGGPAINPTSALIYKLVHMSCLAVYWNTDTRLIGSNSLPGGWENILKKRIARHNHTPSNMQYLLSPISARANLQLTMKPDSDYTIPKALATLILKEISISLGKKQYQNMMRLVESFDRMVVNLKYLRYKPSGLVVKEDPRAWWVYAITAVLEEDVKRRTQMWSWKHIREHRTRCKKYTKLYLEKLTSKNVSAELQSSLEELEVHLDVLNITLCRQLAENKVERQRLVEQKKKAESERDSWWAWSTSWVTGSSPTTPTTKTAVAPPSVEELAIERAKLYEALDYSEDAEISPFPKEYVAYKVSVQLETVSVGLHNEEGPVANLSAQKVGVNFSQRPGAHNISVSASLGSLKMTGKTQGEGKAPLVVTTTKYTADALLNVGFELKPLASRADYSIRAQLQPIQIVYDAATVDAIIGMFLLPSEIQLQKLSAAASFTVEEVKTQGRAGLSHSISRKKVMAVDLHVHSPYVVVPEDGTLSGSPNVLLLDLGSLRVLSDTSQIPTSVTDASLEQLQKAFYDHYDVQLRDVQVIVARATDDWEAARKNTSSSLHILQPTRLDLQLEKCLMTDTQLPKIKLKGELPSLTLSLSDRKIKQVIKIIQSLPLPPPSLANKPEASPYRYKLEEPTLLRTDNILLSMSASVLDQEDEEKEEVYCDSEGDAWYSAEDCDPEDYDPPTEETYPSPHSSPDNKVENTKSVSITKLVLNFDIHKIAINFSEHKEATNEDLPRLNLLVSSVSTSIEQHTWDVGVSASIGSLAMHDYYARVDRDADDNDSGVFTMLEGTADHLSGNQTLLSVAYLKCEGQSPQYPSRDQSTQSIKVDLSLLIVRLQRESLANLLTISKSIAAELRTKSEEIVGKKVTFDVTDAGEKSSSQMTLVLSKRSSSVITDAADSKTKELHLEAVLAGVNITLCDYHGDLLTANIRGITTAVDIDHLSTSISASLTSVTLVDSEPGGIHTNVISQMDDHQKVLSATVKIFKNSLKSDLNQVDLSIAAQVQRLKVTVVFRFLNRVKEYVSQFLSQLPKLDQRTVDSAKKAAVRTASITAGALKEQSSSRVLLDIVLFAPIIVLPLTSSSQSALVADLGTLKVQNMFLLASDIASGQSQSPESFTTPEEQKAIVDKMNIVISSIQLGRVCCLKEGVLQSANDHMIIKPVKLTAVVVRSLSRWCKVVPDVDVFADLKSLEVQFSPENYQAIMSIINSLSDGVISGEPHKTSTHTPEESIQLSLTASGSQLEGSNEIEETDEISDGPVVVKVKAVIGVINLLLHSSEGELSSIGVQGVSSDMYLHSGDIHLNVGITDIKVMDLSSSNSQFPEIVSLTEGSKALEAKIGVYPNVTKSEENLTDMGKCDLSVDASVGQLRVVVLFLFVNKMAAYFKQFGVSQGYIDRAKKSAQENASAAVTAVQEQHKSGQRVKLNVCLKAPEIIIPIRSDMTEVIVADLGILSLSNTFSCVDVSDGGASQGTAGEQLQPPIFEEYTIQLRNLQVYRTILKEECSEGQPRSLVLEPFNLEIAMKRNLSLSWYTGIPTIDLDAKLGNLKMVVSDADIEAICGVISGNLQEGSMANTPTLATNLEEEKQVGTAVEIVTQQEREDTPSGEKIAVDASSAPTGEVFKTFVLSANLKSIEIELFKMTSTSDRWTRGSKDSLAGLIFHQFEASVCMESNSALDISVSLLNCFLDNKRCEKQGNISRLIKKVSGTDSTLISVGFQKHTLGDSNVLCNVESVQVLLDLVFILTLIEFFKSSVSSLAADISRDQSNTEIKELGVKIPLPVEEAPVSMLQENQDSTDSGSTDKTSSNFLSVEERKVDRMTINVNISSPLIALVENPTNENSRALVFGTEVHVSMVNTADIIDLKTTISDLSIFSVRVNNLQNRSTKVLESSKKPVTASFMTVKDKSMDIDVSLPDITLTVSPTTVRLLLHVVQSLKLTDKSEEEEIGETSPLDIWDSKPVDPDNWFLIPLHEPEVDAGTSVDMVLSPQRPTISRNEKATLTVDGLILLIEQEFPSGELPVIALSMGKYRSKALTLNVENWSNKLYLQSELSLEAASYNVLHDAWEPLVEPVVGSIDVGDYKPWTLRASITNNVLSVSPTADQIPLRHASTSRASTSKQDDIPPEMSVEVFSDSPLMLTITKSSLGMMKDLLSTYLEEESCDIEETDTVIPETLEATFLLKNELGRNNPLGVRTKDTLKVHGAYSSTVQHGSTVPLHPVSEVPVLNPGEFFPRKDYKKIRVHIVILEVRGFCPIDVALGTSDRVYYPLTPASSAKPSDKEAASYGLVVDIHRHAGRRVPIVTVRSPLQIMNNLKETVKVFWLDYRTQSSTKSLPDTPIITLHGKSMAPLPLETVGGSASGFYLQPDIPDVQLSKQTLTWKTKDESTDLECFAIKRSLQGSTRCKPFFIHIAIDKERYTKLPPISLNSRAHHVFTLTYPVVVQSLIPIPVSIAETSRSLGVRKLKPGDKTFYSHVILSEDLRLYIEIDYNGQLWSSEVKIDERSSESITFNLFPHPASYNVDSGKKDSDHDTADKESTYLQFTIRKEDRGNWHLTIFCPYWIVNKTGLSLEYSEKDVIIPHQPGLPIALFPHQKAKVRVIGPTHQHSEWSKVFSLDVIGSEGVFQCVDIKSNQEYQIGTTVKTSNIGLSKIITLSPLFLAFNQTRDVISFKVEGNNLKTANTVNSKQLLPFWPPKGTSKMCLSVNDSKMERPSNPFGFTDNTSLLVKTRDKIPAVVTDIQVTGSANIVTFNPYYKGAVPVKLINCMEYDVQFNQLGESNQLPCTLAAGSTLLYTWSNPALQNVVNWRLVNSGKPLKMKSILPKDSHGKFMIPKKLIPKSASTSSITSLTEGGIAPVCSTVSKWDEESAVFDEPDGWDDSMFFEKTSDGIPDKNLLGDSFQSHDQVLTDESGSESELDEHEQGTDSVDFSLTKEFKKFGKSFVKKARGKRSKKHQSVGYWVSFLDGLQRVILFTTSENVWNRALGGIKTEGTTADITLSLEEVGVSLVNDHKGLEVAYVGIPPSKPQWQTLKRWNRWKPVSNDLENQLEELIDNESKAVGIIDIPKTNYKIDFTNESDWALIEKNGSRRRLRRSRFQGVFVQLSLSEHVTSVEARINALQIDNNLPFSLNPTILYVFPPPPTIASCSEPKPFIEGSLIMRKTEYSHVKQVQLLQVLVQEIGLNVDINFLLAITGLLDQLPHRQTETELIEMDMSLSKVSLKKSKVQQVSAAATRNYYKTLHLSPLDIHLSFYLNRDSSYKDKPKYESFNPVIGAVISVFSQFGALIGRTKDAELQLNYFEQDNVALTQLDLISRIQKHYTQQAALQMYSIVLGLEVLGNPVGFLKGVKDGTVGLFYHPIQGAVLGPEEFFEGLSLGGRQFFSGTIGGLSGAVGRVSGVLGDAAAKLTLDDDYQEKRRRTGGTDSLIQGVEGAAKGVFAGLTGVVTQPYKGARKEGAWGAFKGLGKGVLGIILRPTAGLLDLTSATFNVVQKRTKVGDTEVAQIRAARYIGPEMIIYPYSPRMSAGYALFMAVDNGRLVDTDIFYDHVELIADPLKVLLVTNRQLAVVKHNSLLNRFDDDFTVMFTEFRAPVKTDSKQPNVMIMPVKEETFSLSFISGKKSFKNSEKTLTFLNSDIAKRAVEMINQSYDEFLTTACLTFEH